VSRTMLEAVRSPSVFPVVLRNAPVGEARRRVAQPSDGKQHRGCPILRGFLRRACPERSRRGGRQTDRTMGLAFHAACTRNEIFPQPSFTRTGPDSSRK
jgi:hypothetical protein